MPLGGLHTAAPEAADSVQESNAGEAGAHHLCLRISGMVMRLATLTCRMRLRRSRQGSEIFTREGIL